MRIGKTRIQICAIGCIECGTQWSNDWQTKRSISVAVEGHKPITLDLKICGDCMARSGVEDVPAGAGGSARQINRDRVRRRADAIN